jgi:hypothetical protein
MPKVAKTEKRIRLLLGSFVRYRRSSGEKGYARLINELGGKNGTVSFLGIGDLAADKACMEKEVILDFRADPGLTVRKALFSWVRKKPFFRIPLQPIRPQGGAVPWGDLGAEAGCLFCRPWAIPNRATAFISWFEEDFCYTIWRFCRRHIDFGVTEAMRQRGLPQSAFRVQEILRSPQAERKEIQK